MGARLIQIILIVLVSMVTVACSRALPLTGLEYHKVQVVPPRSIDVDFCTDPAVAEKFVVKTLFILDHSGSNKNNYLMSPDGSGAPAINGGSISVSTQYATDPTGLFRYGSINAPGTLLNYLHTAYTIQPNDPLNPTRYFALVDFSDHATTYPGDGASFTPDIQDFYNHVLSDSQGGSGPGGSPNDSGSTSYLSALGAAYKIIGGDIQSAMACAKLDPSAPPSGACPNPGVAVASSYVVVFISDGAPITKVSGVGVDASGNIVVTGQITVTSESTTDILGQVATLMGLTSNTKYVAGINLFTLYYYNPANNIDQSGELLLAEMAKVGNGLTFTASSTGTQLDYAQFVPPSKRIKYTLADVFVTNSSVVWWTDGTLKKDTDGDGLPDEVELAWGSNPDDPDTNGNGVSDLVEYQLGANSRHDYASNECSGIKSQQVNGRIVFHSSDPDGLNDCEKLLLSDVGGIDNPDSNGDIIPDWLEFKNGVPFQLGTASAAASSAIDGYTDYQKIKLSLPATYPVSQVLNLQPATYDLTQVSTSPEQDCYHLEVTDLPILGDGNRIQVDIVLKSELLQDRYLYRTAQKAFAPGALTLQFNDWNDPAEKAAGTWKVWP